MKRSTDKTTTQLNGKLDAELARRTRIRAAEEGRFPRDVMSDALEIYLALPLAAGGDVMPPPNSMQAAS
jgi:hypothetical protein